MAPALLNTAILPSWGTGSDPVDLQGTLTPGDFPPCDDQRDPH